MTTQSPITHHIALTTSNPFMTYLSASMSKLHIIEHLALTSTGHQQLFENKDLIGVSQMPGNEDITLMGKVYGGNRAFSLVSKHSEITPFTNIYVKAFDEYFQVAFVTPCERKANAFMVARPDVGLIDTIKLTSHQLNISELYVIAAIEKSKIKSTSKKGTKEKHFVNMQGMLMSESRAIEYYGVRFNNTVLQEVVLKGDQWVAVH